MNLLDERINQWRVAWVPFALIEGRPVKFLGRFVEFRSGRSTTQ